MLATVSSRLPEIISTLKVLKNVVALAPLGEQVGAGIELAISICEMAQSAKVNKAAYEELGLRISALLAGISNVVQKAPGDRLPSIRANLEDVIQVLTSTRDTIRIQTTRSNKPSKNFFKKWKGSHAEKDSEEISAMEIKISAALERFQIESNIRIELVTQKVAEMMKQVVRDAEMARFDNLNHIGAARYDSHELQDQVTSCLEDTRVGLLAELDAWASSNDGAPFFWLNGLAGTGKSTVARTFCERTHGRKDGSLHIASFFASRYSAERRKAMNILHTFVYQLALLDEDIRSSATRALAEEPDLLSRSLDQQVKKLLDDGIKHLKSSRSFVLVLDALDECEVDSLGREGGQLLLLLARSVNASGGSVKLLVTSRLEPTIRDMFNEIQKRSSQSQVLQLHDIDRAVVRNDIRQYLMHSLYDLAQRIKTTDWPSDAQVDTLLDNADVLFVYAATVIRYISHRRFDPRKRLEQVLARTGNSSKSAYRQLDILYQGLLENAMAGADDGEDEPEILEQLRTMLATVVLLAQPLSPSSIASLLDWSLHETEITLAHLSAVLIVHGDEPVLIFHPSFPDFLLDKSRCTDPRLHFDSPRHHSILACRSLVIMSSLLHKDMLGTGLNSLDKNANMLDLDGLVAKGISTHLRYAVLFWMFHIVNSLVEDNLLKSLDLFCHGHLLHWLECLSYLNEIDIALSGLVTVTEFLEGSTPTKSLLAELSHILREYCAAIRISAAHIYQSALTTMPSCRLYELNMHETGDVILRTQGSFAESNPAFVYMEGAVSEFSVLATSSDRAQFACKSSSSVYLGNTTSGEMSRISIPLSTTRRLVDICALQFSTNGRHLLAANQDGHIYIRNLEVALDNSWTQSSTAYNADYLSIIKSAAFSPAGDYYAFAFSSYSRPCSRLMLRSVQIGADLDVLYDSGNDQPSSTVMFTPDAQYVVQAYGSYMVVCDVAQRILHRKIMTGEGLRQAIGALATVSNNSCASMTANGTVRLWDIIQGSHIRTLYQGHDRPSPTFSLACSLDGSMLGAVVDHTLRVIRIVDSSITAEHTIPYCRPGDMYCASVALDVDRSRVYVARKHEKTLFLWEYQKAAQSPEKSATTSRNTECLAASADGQIIASGANDGSLTVWETRSGLRIAEHAGEGPVTRVQYTYPNARFLMTTRQSHIKVPSPFDYPDPRDGWFQVNDTLTGEILRRISDPPYIFLDAVASSPDGKYLALRLFFDLPGSRGSTGTLYVLNTLTDNVVAQSSDEGSEKYCQLTYTPDGLGIIQTCGVCEGSILVRDSQDLSIRHTFLCDHISQDDRLAVSPCSTLLGRLHEEDLLMVLSIWNIEHGEKWTSINLPGSRRDALRADLVRRILMHILTSTALVYASDQGVYVCNLELEAPLAFHAWPKQDLPAHPRSDNKVNETRPSQACTLTPWAVCASQDGSCMYAWFNDGTIRGWAIANFDMEAPILNLQGAASLWPREMFGGPSLRHIMCVSSAQLQIFAKKGPRYCFKSIDLVAASCSDVGSFEYVPPLSKITRWDPVAVTNERLYIHCKLRHVRELMSQLPLNEDANGDDWLQTLDDYTQEFQHTLLHVLNSRTSELEAIITWNPHTLKPKMLPISSTFLRPLHTRPTRSHIKISPWDPADGYLHIQRTLPPHDTIHSLYIPSHRRPMNDDKIVVCDQLVAMMSPEGILSIFDFEKVLKRADWATESKKDQSADAGGSCKVEEHNGQASWE